MKEWNYENEQWVQLPGYLKHLPLFTRHKDFISYVFRLLWALLLKGWFFRAYIRLEVKGSFDRLIQEQPRLLLISNHGSHLDATSIAAAIPFRFWLNLYIAAAKDYFFSNWLFTFFSQHCLGAIPIDRKDKKGEAVNLCLSLLRKLPQIWLIIFPEGTRSKDGYIQPFKKGISVFSQKTNTPILFLYLKGNQDLWPKGRFFAKPGRLTLFVGPVHPPADIEEINRSYQQWVKSVCPEALRPESASTAESI